MNNDAMTIVIYLIGFFVTPFIVYPWAKNEGVAAPDWFAVVCGAIWFALVPVVLAYFPLKYFTKLLRYVWRDR